MKNSKFLPTMLSIVFFLVSFHLSVSAQTDDKNRIANVSASGDTIRLDVLVQHAGATLSVAASNGKVYRKAFKAGESPVFAIYDKNGVRLPDGQFTYDLRLAPVLSPELKKEMAASREKGDDAAEDMEDRVRTLLPSHPLVQSGAFAVLRGSIIVAGGVEPNSQQSASKTGTGKRKLPQTRSSVPPNAYLGQEGAVMMEAVASRPSAGRAFVPGFAHAAFPDDVIPDDLIVLFSACVGNDCVNGEVFNFDTIRMKENNTRLAFNDTSTTAGFPTRDWRIRANSSASGGLSAFFIDDMGDTSDGSEPVTATPFTIESGALTNSVYVDSTSRVGFRTSTPALDLHANTSNTPAIRLEQNSSGGFTAQTWDIGSNDVHFFIRDTTGGSRLPFRIRPGALTSSVDIHPAGEVGIMTTNPLSTLDVSGNALTVGSESGTNGRTTNTTKLTRIAVPPYTNTNLSFAAIGAATTATDNAVAIGGSAAGFAAATFIIFNTAANNNTDTGTERMRITSAGNVGIGTSAPTSKLEVNGGDIRVTGGSFIDDGTTLNVPDYVFEDNYPLMSLDELRAYIARQKHLPNMPSAAEVRQKGLNLSQYQMKLLEKIEELTLHVLSEQKLRLEQQKEIEQLKAQIQQLQPRANRGRGARNRHR